MQLLTAIKAFSEGKVKVADGKVVDAKGMPILGCDLTREIVSKL